jgi:hypothetical protein
MNVKRSYALNIFLMYLILDTECRTPYTEMISVSYVILVMLSLNGILLNSSEGHARISCIIIN